VRRAAAFLPAVCVGFLPARGFIHTSFLSQPTPENQNAGQWHGVKTGTSPDDPEDLILAARIGRACYELYRQAPTGVAPDSVRYHRPDGSALPPSFPAAARPAAAGLPPPPAAGGAAAAPPAAAAGSPAAATGAEPQFAPGSHPASREEQEREALSAIQPDTHFRTNRRRRRYSYVQKQQQHHQQQPQQSPSTNSLAPPPQQQSPAAAASTAQQIAESRRRGRSLLRVTVQVQPDGKTQTIEEAEQPPSIPNPSSPPAKTTNDAAPPASAAAAVAAAAGATSEPEAPAPSPPAPPPPPPPPSSPPAPAGPFPLAAHSLLTTKDFLRPEAAETLFYLWRATGDEIYREWGWNMFRAFERWCRVGSGGYATMRDVNSVGF
jgi:hypothetical protein